MGFEQQSLDAALRRHLTDNFGKAAESVPMVGGGTKFSVTGGLVIGPSRAARDITTAWGIDGDALIRLISGQEERSRVDFGDVIERADWSDGQLRIEDARGISATITVTDGRLAY